jgi:phycocyanobilin lyase subunit beta
MKTIDLLVQSVGQAASHLELSNAVQDLAGSRLGSAIPTLIAALGYNNSAAASAVNGLVSIGRTAVEPLISLVDDGDYGARAYAVKALAMIGDPRSLEILVKCAETDFDTSVRRIAIKGLGSICWDWVEWDANTVKSCQTRILDLLSLVLEDEDWSIRYATIVALNLVAEHRIDLRVISLLKAAQSKESDLVVRARAEMALASVVAVTS